jgi:sugar lactone lactonase YvrE
MKKIIFTIVMLMFALMAFPQDSIPNIISSYTSVTNTFTYDVIVNSSNQVNKPRDLDFHPNGDLWIINTGTENSGGSTVKITNPGITGQSDLWQQDGNAWHFMSLPSSIAFSDNGNFATSTSVFSANHNDYPYTGPTLWSSDPLIYAIVGANPTPAVNGSHLDMLHESPYSMGIASEKDNVFWVYDDYNSDIVRYDFASAHVPGGDIHADGRVRRFQDMGLSPVNDGNDWASSTWVNLEYVNHLELDDDKKWLYFVDGGNQRILRLDITTGTTAGTPDTSARDNLAEYQKMIGFVWEEVVITGLDQPAGIDIIDDRLVVTDHSNGDIIFYDVSNVPATEIGRVQTNEPGIMGVVVGPNGRIWYANAALNKVVKIEPSSIIADVEEDQLVLIGNRIYPNPVFNTLHFNSTANFVSISDLNGKLILANNNINTIDVSMFSKGVYFIDVDGVKSKFIKY